MKTPRIIIALFFLHAPPQAKSYNENALEDSKLDFMGLASKYKHPAIKYDVVTEDGYVLDLYRLPGKGLPHLLMHGLADTSDTWLLRGNSSLAITMATGGYDVWVGNVRGNRYARRHLHLDPDKNDSFWDFSVHEHGYYDLASIIDTILSETGQKKLNAIGHSQGNTIFYVLGSTRPEYNAKVNVIIALAPIAYLQNTPIPLATLLKSLPALGKSFQSAGIYELLGHNSSELALLRNTCAQPGIGYILCVEGFLFFVSGVDREEFEYSFHPVVNMHFPAGVSTKNLIHFGQFASSKIFARYDYGEVGNKIAYNSASPPKYNLKKVTMRIVLMTGMNDNLSRLKDIMILRKQLPNVVQHMVPRELFNHMDCVWGKSMGDYLFPGIFDIWKKYS